MSTTFGPDASRARRVAYIVLLGALTAVAPLTVDLYLPAFPAIVGDLGVPESAVQVTLTGALLGLGLGQLVIGPLSDAFGRRWPLVASVAIHVVASLCVAAVGDVGAMTTLRVVQGAASSAGIVIAMASVRDLYSGARMSRIMAQLALVSGLGPVLAPSIGALILQVTQWRGMFVWLATFSVVLLVAVLVLVRETLPKDARAPGHWLGATFRRYRVLLLDREFLGLAVTGGLMKGGQFSYIAWSSFVFQGHFGLDERTFALVFAGNAVGTILGAQLAGWLSRRLELGVILSASLLASLGVGVVLCVVVFAVPAPPLIAVALPICAFMVCIGLNNPTVPSLAMVSHAREAGTAAALLGAINFAFAGVAAPVGGLVTRDPLAALAGSLIVCSTAAIAVHAFVTRGGPRGIRILRHRPAD